MASFYEEMRAVASDVINQFKQGRVYYVALTHSGGTVDNPGEPTEVETELPAVVRGVQFKYVDGTNIIGSDQQLTMTADGVVPTINGFIKLDGVRHKIVSVSAIPPAGDAVAYRVIFRR